MASATLSETIPIDIKPKGRRLPVLDLTDQRFGLLVVSCRHGNDIHGHATWLCLCDCGRKKITSGHKLSKGQVKSCGCAQRRRTRKVRETSAERVSA